MQILTVQKRTAQALGVLVLAVGLLALCLTGSVVLSTCEPLPVWVLPLVPAGTLISLLGVRLISWGLTPAARRHEPDAAPTTSEKHDAR